MNNIEDKKIKTLLADTKLKADGRLKYRIMQQIETEKALSRKVQKSPPYLWNTLSAVGIIYVLTIIIGVCAYLYLGKEALTSPLTYIPMTIVLFICGLFWMISCFDDRRHSKSKE